MHNVNVTLENEEGLRLTLSIPVSVRNTSYENEARAMAEQRANVDHAKHGTWHATHSHFTS